MTAGLAAAAAGLGAASVALGLRWWGDHRRTLRAVDRALGRDRGGQKAAGWRAWAARWRSTPAAAALRLRWGEAQIGWAAAAAAGAVVGAAWRGPVGLLAGAVAGGGTAWAAARLRTARWVAQADAQWPEALRALAAAMRAGVSLDQAWEAVASETPDPLGAELRRVARRHALGLAWDDALADLAARLPLPDLPLARTAIAAQQQAGGSLAAMLDALAETAAARQRLRSEVRALTAPGRMTAFVLIAMPIALAAFLGTTQPGYFDPLVRTAMGRWMLAGAAAGLAVGAAVVWRIVNGSDF